MSSLPVLVVGAGPSGLVLALSLLRANVPFRIIEKSTTHHKGTRGAGMMPRSIELLQILGVLPEVSKCRGMPAPPMRLYKLPGGIEALKTWTMTETVDVTPARPFGGLWFVSQALLEETLRKELKKGGCAVEFGKELVDFSQDDDSITAKVVGHQEDQEGTEEIQASFIVGTDGAKGSVRKVLKLGLLGKTLDSEGFLVANATVKNLDIQYWHLWKTTEGLTFSFRPYDADGPKFVITITGSSADLEGRATPAGLQELFASRVGRDDVEFGEFEWISFFRPNMRVVNNFGQGRAFLAGDAAHVHSPHGGQGLNTSIQDSFNLAWKLALIQKGLGRPSLVDTYNEERMPVIAEMLKQVTGLYHKSRDPKDDISTGSLFRGKDLFMLGNNYRWSSIVLDERTPSIKTMDLDELKERSYLGWDDNICAGDRAPSASGLVDSSGKELTLFDVFSPAKHTILIFGTSTSDDAMKTIEIGWPIGTAQTVRIVTEAGAAAASGSYHADFLLVDRDGHAHDSYRVVAPELTVVIVRPDGFIGAVLHTSSGVSAYLALIFKDSKLVT